MYVYSFENNTHNNHSTLELHLRLVHSNLLIPAPIPHASPGHVVHTRIIHLLPVQQRHATLLTPKHRPIAPEVLTIAENSPRERIAALALLPIFLRLRAVVSVESNGEEDIEAEHFLPRRETSFFLRLLVRVAVRSRGIGAGARGGYGGCFRAQGAGCYGAHDGAHRVGVAAHAFVGGQGAGDLDEVHEEQHESPGKLQAAPDVGDEGQGVFGPLDAEVGVEDFAVHCCSGRGGEGRDVCEKGC